MDPSLLYHYMSKAISLSRKSFGMRVGALVLDVHGKPAGEGYRNRLEHTKFIQHAERNALFQATGKATGGTLITTLEPCVHAQGKDQVFAPCSELIVKCGIKRVIFGVYDRYAKHFLAGDGERYLNQRGVETVKYEGGDLELQIEKMLR